MHFNDLHKYNVKNSFWEYQRYMGIGWCVCHWKFIIEPSQLNHRSLVKMRTWKVKMKESEFISMGELSLHKCAKMRWKDANCSMHHRLDSATLLLLAFPWGKQPKLPKVEIPVGQWSCKDKQNKKYSFAVTVACRIRTQLITLKKIFKNLN